MMNQRLRLYYVCVLWFGMSPLYSATVMAAQPDRQIDRLAKAYRAARTDLERRAVCLDAIDAGVLARDRPVGIVDAIFGTAYAGKLPRRGELETGVVDFHPPLLSGNEKAASGYIGWYLAFKFDFQGRLQNYYLTNLHK